MSPPRLQPHRPHCLSTEAMPLHSSCLRTISLPLLPDSCPPSRPGSFPPCPHPALSSSSCNILYHECLHSVAPCVLWARPLPSGLFMPRDLFLVAHKFISVSRRYLRLSWVSPQLRFAPDSAHSGGSDLAGDRATSLSCTAEFPSGAGRREYKLGSCDLPPKGRQPIW